MLVNQKLPDWAMTDFFHLVSTNEPNQNDIGESSPAPIVESGPHRCAKFPVSARVQTLAELQGIRADWELYTKIRGIIPERQNIRILGKEYRVFTVSEWEHFSVLGVSEIEP